MKTQRNLKLRKSSKTGHKSALSNQKGVDRLRKVLKAHERNGEALERLINNTQVRDLVRTSRDWNVLNGVGFIPPLSQRKSSKITIVPPQSEEDKKYFKFYEDMFRETKRLTK